MPLRVFAIMPITVAMVSLVGQYIVTVGHIAANITGYMKIHCVKLLLYVNTLFFQKSVI